VAFTRKAGTAALLRELGASEVRAPETSSRALEPERWAGAIDNVGGEVLSTLLRSTRAQGGVAAVGLAAGAELAVSLMPFLLRGVNLLGVNSAGTRRDKRLLLWQRIASDLAPRHLERIATTTVELDALPAACEKILSGVHVGRTLVRIGA
jgi:NADPH2:quinone reductase